MGLGQQPSEDEDAHGKRKDFVDTKVEEIWHEVYRDNPLLMDDWTNSSSLSFNDSREAMLEIKLTLTLKEYQTDQTRNFLWRLKNSGWREYGYLDSNGDCKDRSDLAMLFTRVMERDSYFEDFLATTRGLGKSDIDFTKDKMAISAPTSDHNTTSLHTAAILGNVDGVRILVEEGELIGIWPNRDGFTPLHFAAMAIHPQPQIAKLLIESVNGKSILDEQTNDTCGGNTALHLAAANVNIKEEFIQHFKHADWKLRNSRNHTPFHVAAKSNNREAIIYMLNTFSTTNYLQDYLQDVDVNRQDTLLKLCARKGNAPAVALLIEHGADIADGVLYEIVLESVRNPRKVESLKRVYHSVVDNVVTWRNLRKEGKAKPEPRFLLVMDSVEYEKRFRMTMFWLLTSRSAEYGNQSVLECALNHGAVAMVWEIIHTRSVFRLQGDRARQYVEGTPVPPQQPRSQLQPHTPTPTTTPLHHSPQGTLRQHVEMEHEHEKEMYDNAESCKNNWTVFDITNFTKETYNSKDSCRPHHEHGEHTHGIPDMAPDAEENEGDLPERIPLLQNAEEHSEPSNARNINFKEPGLPNEPYLTCMLSAYDKWRSSNILSTQPFSELMKPYIKTVQCFYFILGLLQLIVMLSFTVCRMPTTCSVALMFNVSATGCSSSTGNDSDSVMLSSFSQQRSWTAMFWLIWPIFLFAQHFFMAHHYIKNRHAGKFKKLVSDIRPAQCNFNRSSFLIAITSIYFLTKLYCYALFIRKFPVTIFFFTNVGWLCVYFWSESHEPYLQVTSMVLLFGWITNVILFGSVMKKVSILNMVLERITVKDISSFMLFFAFTVIGFSFAMHTIHVSMCMPNRIIHLHDTFFAVLLSAFRIGDYFDSTITDSTCGDANGSTHYMFEFVYLGYVCATIIILLNILIAMLSNRYAIAKLKAENEWRFEMLFTITALRKIECFNYCRGNKECISFVSTTGIRQKLTQKLTRYYFRFLTPESYRYNKDINRHYLLLPEPVNEELHIVAASGIRSSQVIPRPIRS